MVPGAEYVCIVAVRQKGVAATVCETTDQALRHGVLYTGVNPDSGIRTMVGVLPNGFHEAIIRSGRASVRVRAPQGLFVHRDAVSAPPDEMILP